MYVLVDMEWISNQRGDHWPTQLAAARVDAQWNTVKCKKPYTGLDRRIFTCYNNILYSGIAKLVSRLVWDQETVRSSRTTRTKIPLKSTISEGFSYSLSIAAQNLRKRKNTLQ